MPATGGGGGGPAKGAGGGADDGLGLAETFAAGAGGGAGNACDGTAFGSDCLSAKTQATATPISPPRRPPCPDSFWGEGWGWG